MLLFSFSFPAHLHIDKPSLTLPALKEVFLGVLGGKNAFRLLRTFKNLHCTLSTSLCNNP